MATFASLTAEQQAQLKEFQLYQRALIQKFAALVNQFRDWNNDYVNGGVGNIIATLDAGAIIPDTNSLASSSPMGHDDMVIWMGKVQEMLASYDTPNFETFFIKAIGPANTASRG